MVRVGAYETKLVAEGLDCKFSKSSIGPVYCIVANDDDHMTITALNNNLSYIDKSTGKDKSMTYTSVIVSGTNPKLNKFEESVFKFKASNCIQK